MSGMTSQEVWMFATGKLFNQWHKNLLVCDLIVYMIYVSGYKETLARFRLRSQDSEKRYFELYFSESILAVNVER